MQAMPGLEEACPVERRLGPRALGSWIADVGPSCALPCRVLVVVGPMPDQLSRLVSGHQPAYVAFLRRAQPELLRQAEEAVDHELAETSGAAGALREARCERILLSPWPVDCMCFTALPMFWPRLFRKLS